MLKEIALGDAYGAGFEFSNREKINKLNNLNQYEPHDLYGFVGKYTDDTQMSIAICELLIEDTNWLNVEIAEKFLQCFKRDPRKGYSKGFYQLLSQCQSGKELVEVLRNNSDRNGAAMRSVPIGILPNSEEVIYVATEQAKVTHNSDKAIKSSCAVALVAHYGIYKNGKLNQIDEYLKSKKYGDFDFNWTGEVSMDASDTVSAVLTCLIKNREMGVLLKQCVDLGGDTDSVASIALGLASCFTEYKNNIPNQLIEEFDEKKYGLEYLDSLQSELFKKYR